MKKLSQLQIETHYTILMRDTKWRLDNLYGWLVDLETNLPTNDRYLLSEMCFLNFRRVCENIAISTLVVHNRMPQATTNKFLDKWNPGVIFRQLEKLNYDHFPVKMVETKVAPGEFRNFEIVKGEYITSKRVSNIYNRCGDMLHVGSLNSLLKGKKWHADLETLKKWHAEFCDLLTVHSVILPEFSSVLLCILHTVEDGDVKVLLSGTDHGVGGKHRRWGKKPSYRDQRDRL